jgi:hypothetical protein
MTINHSRVAEAVDVDTDTLRRAIKDEYKEVAENPGKGFHFHTGRRLTKIVGYKDEWLKGETRSLATFRAMAGRRLQK